MIEKIKNRFFRNTLTGHVFMETITFILWLTGPVGDDSRCVPIGEPVLHPTTGEMVDLWLPMCMVNPGFDPTVFIPTYETKTVIVTDEESKAVEVQKPISVLAQPSPPPVPYDLPLTQNLVEITMDEYNAAIDDLPDDDD